MYTISLIVNSSIAKIVDITSIIPVTVTVVIVKNLTILTNDSVIFWAGR